MKKNLGGADKIIRLVIAAIIVTLFFMNVISGVLGIVLLALAGILVITSFISFCPIWAILNINTESKE